MVRVLLLLAFLVMSCSSSTTTLRAPSTPRVDDLEIRALVMLLEDRRLWEGFSIESALVSGRQTRWALAFALGRLADARGEEVLLQLLTDTDPVVRRAAAFSLAVFSGSASRAALLRAAADQDLRTAVEAVRSLGFRGESVESVSSAMASLPVAQLWRRLLPSLTLFPRRERLAVAALARESELAEDRRLAGLVINHEPTAASLPILRELSQEDDRWVRGWAIRSLGEVGERQDAERLETALTDSSGFVRTQAAVAWRALLGRGSMGPPAGLPDRLLTLLHDVDAGARLAALSALGELTSQRVRDRLTHHFRVGSVDRAASVTAGPGERCAALIALAHSSSPNLGELLSEAGNSHQVAMRECAARVAGLSSSQWLERLLSDQAPRVRAAALRAWATSGDPGAFGEVAKRGLSDGNAGVRAELYDLLRQKPVLSAEVLLRHSLNGLVDAAFLADVEPDPSARVSLLLAVEARARAERLERGALILLLESAATEDPARPVRLQAAISLAELGQVPPPISPLRAFESVASYRDAVLRSAQPRVVVLETNQGLIRLRIDCPLAPRSCLSFLQLAGQGFFDGQLIMGLDPGVQVVSGDPDASGRGGPGYLLRDERTPLDFDRPGILSLQRPFADGVGSRFSLTLSPQPWRSGAEIAIGQIIDGLDVLARLQIGDTIVRASIEWTR